MGKPNILVVINQYSFPLRSTIRDSIFCFQKYTDYRVYYLNTARLSKIPKHLLKLNIDVIVFHTSFMSFRWGREREYNRLSVLLSEFKSLLSVKIALPQDEWIHTNLLNQFINEFKIHYVFSVAPESEWPIIYNEVDFSKVLFYRILTGYIDPLIVNKFSSLDIYNRQIDVGYRAYKAPPWLGKHGYKKTLIANVFRSKCKEANLVSDISINEKDTFIGDNWYKFLSKCKYFVGVEGGSTVIDRDGKIWESGVKFLVENPQASYETVERAIFPEKEGTLNLIAISPRHLECCVTKTCQILIEGNYNGILIPNIHYIELKKDFSNLDQVINIIKDDKLRDKIAEQAYIDVVASEKYSYPNFVKFLLDTSMQNITLNNHNGNKYFLQNMIHYQKQLMINTFFSIAYKYINPLRKLYFFLKNNLN